jgi:hypothetical protein
MEKPASNVQQETLRAGCGADPNNVGETLSVKGDSNEGGDTKELVALNGHGPSGLGSSKEGANGLAQANSVAANKILPT